MKATMKIGLVGNPNSGKTTLFNALTGNRQRVGNWPGVTVEKKTGKMLLAKQAVKVVDLPGTYSLSITGEDSSIDERIACDVVMRQQVDLIVNIVDAANLERNLYLTTQLLEMQRPMIVVLNMMDIASKRRLHIDFLKLSKRLGCPVIPMVLSRKKGLRELKKAIQGYLLQQHLSLPSYSPLLETAIADVMSAIRAKEGSLTPANLRWYAMRLLEHDHYVQQMVDMNQLLADKLSVWQRRFDDETQLDAASLFADSRYQFIQTLLDNVLIRNKKFRHHLTDVVDAIVLNRFLGLPVFLFVMYLMFEFSITIGGALQPLFDDGSRTIFIDGVNALGNYLHLPLWLTAIFAQGVGLGINTVVTFIPQIACLFLFLCFIETSGYMARAAFVMDRFMQFMGLPGKSFVPLMIGFGCNVPAIMAARTLDNRRDRLLTIMMSPFMSCGARLAIFAVFSTAFFGHHGALVVFLLYFAGIVVAMLTGLVLKLTLLKGESAPFILELPPYHLPSFPILLRHTWMRLKRFIFRAGKVIVPVCLLIGSLNAIEVNGHIHPNGSQNSVLSKAGRVITPVLHPMGVESNNWPATVGLITGVLAKEVVVGTMNTLYSQNHQLIDTQAPFDLWGGLKHAVSDTYDGLAGISSESLINPFTANEADHHMSSTAMGAMRLGFGSPWSAFAYLLFVLLYVPCVSTIAVTQRETHSRKWTWLSVLWSTSIAYAAAVCFYQIVTIVDHPWCSIAWVLGLLLYLTALITAMLYAGRRPKDSEMIIRHRPL